ncbi:hypothetical protein BU15DRAFT_65828 [Melanogaster broomeanus]|nr:hypothetical protein BU15DRAFT_65828 [Melanogaster broomeanus]
MDGYMMIGMTGGAGKILVHTVLLSKSQVGVRSYRMPRGSNNRRRNINRCGGRGFRGGGRTNFLARGKAVVVEPLGAQKKPGLAMIADADAPLSNMLDSERPFLKPIKFVRSTFTPFLFQRSEELPEPLSEEVGTAEESQVPACCSGVCGIQRFFPADSEPEDEASNQLEEIDFADPGRIRADIDAVAAVNQHGDPRTPPKGAMEEIYCADLAMMTPSRSLLTGEVRETVPQEPTEALRQSANGTFAEAPDVLVVEEESPSSSSGSVDASVATPSALLPSALQAMSSSYIALAAVNARREDELIVYVVPHPRSGSASPVPEVPRVKLPLRYYLRERPPLSPWAHRQLSSLTLYFSSQGTAKQPRTRPVFTPAERSEAALKARRKEARIQRLRQLHKGRSAFGSFGAMLSKGPVARGRLEGTTASEVGDQTARRFGWRWEGVDSAVDEVSNGLGGMDLESDVEMGMDAMTGFLTSMGVEGSRFVTMDVIEDVARMQKNEDEDRGEHEENAEEAFDIEEELLIAESEEEVDRTIDDNDGEGTSVDPSEDDGDGKRSPGSSFQARLRKIRERGRGKVSKVARQAPDDDDSDDSLDDGFPPWTRGADDEEFTAQINNTATSSLDINASNNGNNSSATCTKAMWTGMTLDEPMDTQAVSLPVKKGKKGKGKAGYFVDELQAQ